MFRMGISIFLVRAVLCALQVHFCVLHLISICFAPAFLCFAPAFLYAQHVQTFAFTVLTKLEEKTNLSNSRS